MPQPTNNHRNLCRSLRKAPRFCKKKSGSAAENFKKTSGSLLRIPEKPQIDCYGFPKNLRSQSKNSGKTADRLFRIFQNPAPYPPTPSLFPKRGGVPSGISATPLPSVFHFRKRTPTSPLRAKTGDLPPTVPVPKGVFRMECPARRGVGTTPPVAIRGGGVSRCWGGGTPLTARMLEAPLPPS